MVVAWNRRNWFKYCTLIYDEDEHFVASSSFFDLSDCRWRELVCKFVPPLGNWLRATGKEVPTLLLETSFCLQELHEIWDHMSLILKHY